jgi:hypothetical protein
MVVKVQHAVVAHVAVGRPDWPKDQACLAEFELADHLVAMLWLTDALYQIADALRFHQYACVLMSEQRLDVLAIQQTRDDPWVCGAGNQ